MNRYPGLAKVPWYKAVIEPGDCLYLPYEWIHQVRDISNTTSWAVIFHLCGGMVVQVSSTERNMGINVWWIRFS